LVLCSCSFAQSECWVPLASDAEQALATDFLRFELNPLAMKVQLKQTSNQQAAEILLPDPAGNFVTAVLWETAVLPEQLANKYPGIRTYGGYIKGAPWIWVRADFTYAGFHALFQTENGLVGVIPESEGSARSYQVFYKNDEKAKGMRNCGYDEIPRNKAYAEQRRKAHAFGPGVQEEVRLAREKFNGSLLFYRFAVAATGEYSAVHGGTKPLVLSAITTSVNNLNAVVGRDMNLQFQLVPDNDTLIYFNAATDPFDPSDAFDMLDSSQAVIDRLIRRPNYDLGHVITHGFWGGIAASPSACNGPFKGQGYSSNIPSSRPRFDIDYLAHEVGHQLGAPHNFSATSCFNAEMGYHNEPGSGTTIMCYAGTCGPNDNVQNASDAMFHAINIADCASYLTGPSFANCPTTVPTGNSVPVANAGADLTIPSGTPFCLVGSATDANNPADLTYSWEQIDGSGPETAGAPDPTATNNALFRTFLPQTSPVRYFPNLSDLAGGTTSWEILPTVARNMNFTFMVRDNFTYLGNAAGDRQRDGWSASGKLPQWRRKSYCWSRIHLYLDSSGYQWIGSQCRH
jgi:hypothetical protein